MQKVSQAYKKSMKSSLRERAYIMLSFGLINQTAQNSAKIENGDFAYYSNPSNMFRQNKEGDVYATMEENFTTVDGGMYFLPRESQIPENFNTGIVSKDLVSAGTYELTITFNVTISEFKGLTIDFGENYPVDFDITCETGTVLEVRDNTQSVYVTENVIDKTSYIKLTFYKMKNVNSRLRIYSIRFGYGLIYYNDSVMDSSLESYVSPIGEDLPQIDFTVQLKNYDKYFNVDNPNSAVNFLETGQTMDIYYGYQLPDTDKVEWLQGGHLVCSEWESDDTSATIKCQDVFRSMDTEYYKGVYSDTPVSFYDLAVAVLTDAGKTDYYLDPLLKRLYSKNPLPRTDSKQALQIIANACRCVLTQTRAGKISIRSNFIPEVTVSCNEEESYSHVENILTDDTKDEYGSFALDYTTSHGEMGFLPQDVSEASLHTGFISKEQSNEDCTFTTNPVITLTQEAASTHFALILKFGSALPAEFIIRTYNNGELVEEITVDDDITKTTDITHDFDDFEVMTIEFTKTAEPYNRIILNYVSLTNMSDFKMERRDMLSSPTAVKQELVKEVIVPCYVYQKGTALESVTGEEVTVSAGDIVTYYVSEPYHGFVAELENVTDGVTVTDSGCYYVTVKYNVSGTYQLSIQAYKYVTSEKYASCKLNDKGKTITWDNPMISDAEMAQDLANWLGEYYQSGIEYEYKSRGNPELDANDIIYQQNDFQDTMRVNVYRVNLDFKQAFSGSIIARRLGG